MNRLSFLKYGLLFGSLSLALPVSADDEHHHHGMHLPRAVTNADYFNQGEYSAELVELGRNLFFDKILSGNKNISCATCHHSLLDTGDGLSLPVGEGGRGLGMTRDNGEGLSAVHERVPRNAPPVFNLDAVSMDKMFHDGRIARDPSQPSGFKNPAGNNLPYGLNNPLAVQAMFPVTSATEMAGQAGENDIADAAAAGKLAGSDGVWAIIAERLRAIPEYVDMFTAAYPDISTAADITYVHAANAIAAFEGHNWRASNSPFDRYLRGDKKAMSDSAEKGMRLFYGKANCASCHSGKFQTDMDFHAIAMPQFGPGKGGGVDGHDDFGREMVTGDVNDRFRFRTPPLRNVALTGPWGHDGAYNTLEAVVRHHLDPENGLQNYDMAEAVLIARADLDAIDFIVHNDWSRRNAIAQANELAPMSLSDKEVAYLIDFLNALTDQASIDLRKDTPRSVPSGLTLVD